MRSIHDNDPIDIVPGRDAERPPWGGRTLWGGWGVQVALMT
jgi:hypothetical protein